MKIFRRLLVLVILFGILGAFGVYLWRNMSHPSVSNDIIFRWLTDPASRAELTTAGGLRCGEAPFIVPSRGFIGLLWADPASPYNVMNRHSGLDIFGDGQPGEVPVYAAYSGYLTRLDEWISSVIIQHDDPLQPGHSIWTYYTHMANSDGSRSFIVDAFPAGTRGVFVQQGTLLGYQGEYAGPGRPPIGLHVHFSVVQSDENGAFRNEALLANTLDPSPYLGMNVDITRGATQPVKCD